MAKTITLEIPDDVAERLEAMPQEQRNNFAIGALRRAWAEEAPTEKLVGYGTFPELSVDDFLKRKWADKEKENRELEERATARRAG